MDTGKLPEQIFTAIVFGNMNIVMLKNAKNAKKKWPKKQQMFFLLPVFNIYDTRQLTRKSEKI
jgi:hypothetical protein